MNLRPLFSDGGSGTASQFGTVRGWATYEFTA
jgi:hypothetical protein